MFRSFEGFNGEAGGWGNDAEAESGDTQPMDSQIYRDLTTSKLWKDGADQLLDRNVDFKSYEDGDTALGLDTQDNTGQKSGLIDLVDHWDKNFEDPSPTSSYEGGGTADELGSQTQRRSQINQMSPPLPRAAPVSMPETPAALAGAKRNYRGEFVSSVSRTPGSALPSFFGAAAGGPAMSLTQIFNQTQAVTSPAIGEPRSDPIFQRPSPEFAHHRSTSPQIPSNSSPTKRTRGYRNGVASQASRSMLLEPREEYVSMKESQELRAAMEKRTDEELQQLAYDNDSDFDDEVTIEERRAARRRLEAQIKERNARQLAELTAPRKQATTAVGPKEVLRPTSTPRKKGEHSTGKPSRSIRQRRETLTISDDVDEDVPDSMDELSPDHPSSQHAMRHLSADDDGVEVPMTSPKHDNSVQKLRSRILTRSTGNRTYSASNHLDRPSSQMSRLLADEQHPSNFSHTIAVADSQPENGDTSQSLRTHRLTEASSLSSMALVAQSVPSSSESQTRERLRRLEGRPPSPNLMIETHSSQLAVKVEDQDGVPSSPPLASAGVLRDDLPERLATQENQIERPARGLSTVPDSELTNEADDNTRHSFRGRKGPFNPLENKSEIKSGDATNTGDVSIDPFDTAQTHITSSAIQRRTSQRSFESRRTPSQVPRLADLALQPTPEQLSLGFNVDELNPVTEDDEQFRRVLFSGSSPIKPIRRRRKVTTYATRTARVAVSEDGDDDSSSLSDAPEEEPVDQVPVQGEKIRHHQGSQGKENNEPTQVPYPKKASAAPVSQVKSKNGRISKASGGAKAGVGSQAPGSRIRIQQTQESLSEEGPRERAEVVAPDRVIALFKGGKTIGYYPATYLRFNQSTCRVRFDDGAEDDKLEPFHIFNFALKVGDVIKVDKPNMRQLYVVAGFADKIEPVQMIAEGDPNLLIDQFGYKSIILEAKIAASKKTTPTDGPKERVKVDICLIYFSSNMVSNYKDRLYNHLAQECPTAAESRLQTPSVANQSFIDTPPSRSRRNTAQPLPGLWNSAMLHVPESNTMFANMFFALSFPGDDDTQRSETMDLILHHGGTVLETFETLFMNPDAVNASFVKSPGTSTKPNPANTSTSTLTLTPTHQSVAFAALIATRHSRTPKYMQALALNLPCLSPRWIRDCCAAAAALPWPRYLLPAGDSTFLDGATRSRTLAPYDPTGARLVDTLAARALPLSGKGVLLVGGAGKKSAASAEEKKRLYTFLSFALGAARVRRARDAAGAAALVEGDKTAWDWAYVDGDAAAVTEAATAVLGGAATKIALAPEREGAVKAKGGKGRKRGEREDGGAEEATMFAGDVGGRKFRVAGNEYVVQSLILGEFLD